MTAISLLAIKVESLVSCCAKAAVFIKKLINRKMHALEQDIKFDNGFVFTFNVYN